MKLSILIPVYNEEDTIYELLELVHQVDLDDCKKEIIVINDRSTDASVKKIKAFMKKYPKSKIVFINDGVHRGKGGGIKECMKRSTGDVCIIQDADLEYTPLDYQSIIDKFKTQKVNAVYGSRILGRKSFGNYYSNFAFFVGGVALTNICNLFFGTKITDESTCYKAFRRNMIPKILSFSKRDDFAFEIELTYVLGREGKIVEVPVRYFPRSITSGKKIRAKDFFIAVLTILQCKYDNRV